MGSVVRLYGKRESAQAYALRDYLQRSDIPFEWVELRDNEQARAELGLDSVDDAQLPICIFPDGTRIERPTVRQAERRRLCRFGRARGGFAREVSGGNRGYPRNERER